MLRIKYYIYVFLSKIFGHKWIVKYYRRMGMVIGEHTHIFSKIVTSEPYLISIGNNCTIATNVSLLTHDASIGTLTTRDKYSDLCGRISIGNNCFIGEKAIIMYGVTISNNVIVAAGSIVTKSITQSNVIVAGVPAKVIGTTDDFIRNYKNQFLSLHGLNRNERKRTILDSEDKLVKK